MRCKPTLLALAAGCLLGAAALTEEGAARSQKTFFEEQREDELRAGELLGKTVLNPDGDALGTVEDVVIAPDVGVKAVVIGMGGLFGFGQREVAVNFERLEVKRNDDGFVRLGLDTPVEELSAAPDFVTFQSIREAYIDAAIEAQRRQ